MANGTATPTDNESVNTAVVAIPIPDVYLYQNGPTTHLVNGSDYARARWQDTTVTTMCGGVDVPVGPDDDLPQGVQHLADTLDPEDVSDDPEGVMDLTIVSLCQRCRASYGRDGVPEGVNVARYEMDGSGWER